MIETALLDEDVSEPAPERIDRYLVFGAFARGGTANVHLGRLEASSGLSRVVAIKRVDPSAVTDPNVAKRLLEEARLLFRVRHQCVVPMLDAVRHGGELCLVLEYVHGVSLAALLEQARARGETIPPAVAVAIIADVVRGLHAAHEAKGAKGEPLGIVHRDVSPQNVIVALDGVARVLDFGVAKALGREKLTVTGTTLGKVVYMAPEQIKGLPLSAQADLYSVGVVLWECLTGRSFAEALEGGAAVPALGAALDRVVAKAVSRDARNRYSTGEEMAAELEDALPRATATDVGRLVERLAGDELDRRAELVARAERFEELAPISRTVVTARPPVRAPLPAATPTLASRSAATAPMPTRALLLLALSMLATAALVFAWLTAITASQPPVIAASSSSTTAPPSQELPDLPPPTRRDPPAAPPRVSPPPAPPALSASAPETPAPVVRASALRTSAPRTMSKATRPQVAVPAPAAAPAHTLVDGCDPPFRIEADGRKRYKAECLR